MAINRDATLQQLLLASLLSLAIAARTAGALCAGDCNGDNQVTVDEVLTSVNIALGTLSLNACIAADTNNDLMVTVDEVINALNADLNGCPTSPTPGNSPSPTFGGTTPTVGVTATPSTANTPVPTATPVGPGPRITFFGITTADNNVPTPSTTDANGDPVYARPAGAGFFIVVEAAPGASGAQPGTSNFNSDPANPGLRPDIQLEANQDLGNGSLAVCDQAGPQATQTPGGVPAVPTPSFDPQSQFISNALNDFACRLDRHSRSDACTVPNPDAGTYEFVNPDSTIQFCTAAVVSNDWHFHSGDTVVTVRWRDANGVLSDPKRIVIRVP